MTQLGDLVAKKLTKQLPEHKMKERIASIFKEQTMCVIATASPDGQPRATPLECFADGLTLYIFGDPGQKIENIKRNSKVSLAICNQTKPSWKGNNWKLHKAAQVTGVATILQPNDPESIRARNEVIHWKEYVAAFGRDTKEPPKGPSVVRVQPTKIEYSESALMLEGYSSKQVWVKK